MGTQGGQVHTGGGYSDRCAGGAGRPGGGAQVHKHGRYAPGQMRTMGHVSIRVERRCTQKAGSTEPGVDSTLYQGVVANLGPGACSEPGTPVLTARFNNFMLVMSFSCA